MAVRVNKGSFNIREKLTELGRRFGLKGSELARAETVQDARNVISAGRKNLIINGDMRVSQRLGATGENDLTGSSDGFGVDRFRSWQAGGGELKLQQSTNAPPGFTNSLLHTVNTADTSVAAGDYYMIQQRIEGLNTHHLNWGTSNAKDVTLSFWVRSTVSGVYSVSLWRDNQTYNYVTSYEINNVNTWEYKTVTIPGPTGGTWATNTGTGIGIWWDLGSGTTYSTATTETWGQNNNFRVPSQTSWIGITNAEFRLTGVQLEVGRNATEFEHRHIGEELALCQRYFFTTKEFGVQYQGAVMGIGMGSNKITMGTFRFPVPMRSYASGNITMKRPSDGVVNAAHQYYSITNSSDTTATNVAFSTFVTAIDVGTTGFPYFNTGGNVVMGSGYLFHIDANAEL